MCHKISSIGRKLFANYDNRREEKSRRKARVAWLADPGAAVVVAVAVVVVVVIVVVVVVVVVVVFGT